MHHRLVFRGPVAVTGPCSSPGMSGDFQESKYISPGPHIETLWIYVHSWACRSTDAPGGLSLQDYLPLHINAEILRKYSDDDLNYFKSIGVEPVYYSVIFE
jgi:hypothetical protein